MNAFVDASARPLLKIDVGEEPTLEHFDQIFEQVEAELTRHRSICVLATGANTKRMGLAHVRRIADFGETHHAELEAYVRALAFVIPSAMVRGAMQLAFQLKAPPHPVRICKTEQEAQDYLAPYLDNLRH